MKNYFVFSGVVFFLFVSLSVYATDCNNGGRYEVNGYPTPDGTVTDCRTGLIWLQDANCLNTFNGIDKLNGSLTRDEAIKWVAGLRDTGDPATGCGLRDGSLAGDWRLPTRIEWMAMVAYAKGRYINPALTNAAGTAQWTTNGDAFNNVQSHPYWSSFPDTSKIFDMYDGTLKIGVECPYVGGDYDISVGCRANAWPVRGGQYGTFGTLIIQ